VYNALINTGISGSGPYEIAGNAHCFLFRINASILCATLYLSVIVQVMLIRHGEADHATAIADA